MNCGLKEEKYDIQGLVRESLAGNRSSFEEIVRLYQERAMQLAIRILGNAHDASEAVQDGFVKAYLNIEKLKEPERFESWFFRIIANTAISRRKTATRRAENIKIVDYPGNKKSHSPVEDQLNDELQYEIQKAMLKLSKKQSQAIALFGIEDLSQEQVAQIMNCSVAAVKWHVHKARQKLKVLLKEYLE